MRVWENRLASFVTATTESYSYGPDNERIWRRKLDGTQEVYFYGATGERLATYQLGGPIVEVGRNIYFAGRPVSLAGYQNQYQPYVGMDRLGTVRWSGDYQYHTTKFSYYPYGEEYTTTPQEREKFGTYYRDGSTGLDYARNRYYASTYGRFMTADPYGGSADAADPGSWNRYAYVNGDPVNSNDPSGLDPEGGPPPSGCYFNGFWIPGCDIGGPIRFLSMTAFSRAIQRLGAAQAVLIDRSYFSVNCLNDLQNIAAQRSPAFRSELSINSLIDAAVGAQFRNGVGSTDPTSSLYLDPRAARAAGTGTIGASFKSNPNGLTAESQLGTNTTVGTTIYINASLISNSIATNEGLLLHEALHLLGFDDGDLQRGLGQTVDEHNTNGISKKLQKDCVTGKGNDRIP
jgi:RHS repeat-associated protein